jgi:hypothetical protein
LKVIAEEIDIPLKVGNKRGMPKRKDTINTLATEICTQLQWTKIELMKKIMPTLEECSFSSSADQKPRSEQKPRPDQRPKVKEEHLNDISEKMDKRTENIEKVLQQNQVASERMFQLQREQQQQQFELTQQNMEKQEQLRREEQERQEQERRQDKESQNQTMTMMLEMIKSEKENQRIQRANDIENQKSQQEQNRLMMHTMVDLVKNVASSSRHITDGTVTHSFSDSNENHQMQANYQPVKHHQVSPYRQNHIYSPDQNYERYTDCVGVSDNYNRTDPYFPTVNSTSVVEHPTEPLRPRRLVPIKNSDHKTISEKDKEDRKNNNKRKRNDSHNDRAEKNRREKYREGSRERSRERSRGNSRGKSSENSKKYIRTDLNDGRVRRW